MKRVLRRHDFYKKENKGNVDDISNESDKSDSFKQYKRQLSL